MKHNETIELPTNGKFTRRRMVSALASFGIGAIAGPLVSRQAVAAKSNKIAETKLQAAIFFEPHIPTALQRALDYAGNDGFVASMPQLLHARASASYNNIIWNTWFTANSEENVVTTPQGNQVIVAVHGGGIFASPARFEKSFHADLDRSNTEGLTGQTAAKISEREAHNLLNGKLPDGSEIPVYPFDEFKRGIAGLPMRYAVVLNFDLARRAKRGYESFDVLKDEANMIVRAGGIEPLAVYLDKFRERHNTKLMGNWHPYNRIDPNQPQTRIPFLAGNNGGIGSEGRNQGLGWGYDAEYGMGGDASMVGMARYVAVTPRDVSTSVQNLDFVL
ncbi:MAG: hypothetical protein QGG67_17870 [Gammaproteobacteria bacterium]|jgi:hypothetical protein|nr:hypothetical protein [Dehalococcoidales bacterium]MDP6097832.1 hypothetical protein [Gammaproteobacteria bacterium]|tara:strand:+ start:1195 stop:2193 length:999 start_codon:yes stop_codon:yes gene_type:complete